MKKFFSKLTSNKFQKKLSKRKKLTPKELEQKRQNENALNKRPPFFKDTWGAVSYNDIKAP